MRALTVPPSDCVDAGLPPAGGITEGSLPAADGPAVLALLAQAEDALLRILRRIAVPLLRVSLGVVFLWFGALKVLGATPVTDLVTGTLPWADPGWLIPFLGVVELVIGSGLIAGRTLRFVLLLLTVQLSGTFLVLVVQPDVAFAHGNPLLLTVEGELVIKNIVLLSGALVVASRLDPVLGRPGIPAGSNA